MEMEEVAALSQYIVPKIGDRTRKSGANPCRPTFRPLIMPAARKRSTENGTSGAGREMIGEIADNVDIPTFAPTVHNRHKA